MIIWIIRAAFRVCIHRVRKIIPAAPYSGTAGNYCFIPCYQLMLRPALAYPTIVLIRDTPLADAENTSIKRVCAVTGILSPVRAPFNTVPRVNTPDNAGVRLISVPATGENTLFGVAD